MSSYVEYGELKVSGLNKTANQPVYVETVELAINKVHMIDLSHLIILNVYICTFMYALNRPINWYDIVNTILIFYICLEHGIIQMVLHNFMRHSGSAAPTRCQFGHK